MKGTYNMIQDQPVQTYPEAKHQKDVVPFMGAAGMTGYSYVIAKESSNLGNKTLIMDFSVSMYLDHFRVNNIGTEASQRLPDKSHYRLLGTYILKSVLRKCIPEYERLQGSVSEEIKKVNTYLGTYDQEYAAVPPLSGTVDMDFKDLEMVVLRDEVGRPISSLYKLSIPKNFKIQVFDGQHRSEAFRVVLKHLSSIIEDGKYPKDVYFFEPGEVKDIKKRAERKVSPQDLNFWSFIYDYFRHDLSVTVEVHFCDDVKSKRQLFHNYNHTPKPVPKLLVRSYDSANPIINFSRDILTSDVFNDPKFKFTNNKLSVNGTYWTDLSSLTAVNSFLMTNRGSEKNARHSVVDPRIPEAWEFYNTLFTIPNFWYREKSTANSLLMLKSLGALYFSILWGGHKSRYMRNKEYEIFHSRLADIDFSHSNPLWRMFYWSENPVEFSQKYPKITDFLPPSWRVKIYGKVNDDGIIQFGGRHNDLRAVFAGLIRYQLGLKPNK
jgi:hypothetical protein